MTRLVPLVLLAVSCAPAPAPAPDTTTPDGGTVSTPSSSKGHGGITCDQRGKVTQNGTDYAYCVANVGATELKVVEPATTDGGPLRLAIYLHGDGAGPHNSGLALRLLAPWTTTHRTLLASVRAPNRCAWWLKPSYTTCDGTTPVPEDAHDTGGENAEALAAAIDALRAGWDVSDEPVLFGGSSGGSVFLAASFLPRQGDRFRGAYALSCGGDAPWAAPGWKLSQPAPTQLFFTYGDKDFLVPDIERAVSWYESHGVPTEVKVVPEQGATGSTHCGRVGTTYSYDQIGRVAEVWGAFTGN